MKKVYVSYLNVEELYMLAKTVMSVASNIIGSHPILQIARDAIMASIASLEASIEYTASSAYTSKLKELDDRRDSLYKGLRMYLTTYSQIGTAQQQEAAEYLLRVFESFGNKMYLESYPVESSLMQQFLAKLDEQKGKECINLLQAANIVNDLKQAEQAFETTYTKKTQEESGDAMYPEVLEAKAAVNENIQFILSGFEVLLRNNPSPELESAAKQINEAIETVMSTARARKTRHENTKAEDTATEE